MDLQKWREQRRGEKFTLPSGLDVTARKVDLLDLAVQGGIPAPLAAAADEMVTGLKISVKQFAQAESVINLVVMACIVEPSVVEEPEDGQVGVRELSMQDRLAIYNWANSGVARLKPFRANEGQPVDAA